MSFAWSISTFFSFNPCNLFIVILACDHGDFIIYCPRTCRTHTPFFGKTTQNRCSMFFGSFVLRNGMCTRVVTAAWYNFEFDGTLWSSRLQTDSKYWKFDFVLHFIIRLNIFLCWFFSWTKLICSSRKQRSCLYTSAWMLKGANYGQHDLDI